MSLLHVHVFGEISLPLNLRLKDPLRVEAMPYSRIFSGIDEAYRQDAKSALIWLAFAERPLPLEELAEATIIHPSADPPFDPEERFPEPQKRSPNT